MDILERVRDIGAQTEFPDERVVSTRARVMSGLAGHAPRKRHRALRFVGWGGTLLLATAAVVVGVVIASNLSGMWRSVEAAPGKPPVTTVAPSTSPEPTASPATAISVLEAAARTAAVNTGPVAGSGQYLRVEHQTEQLVLFGPAEHSPYNASRVDATAAWVARGSYVTYIPADRSAEWVRVFEADREITALYGANAAALSQEWDSLFTSTEDIVQRTQGGIGGAYEDSTEPLEGSDAYYARMPREPEQLLQWIRDYQGVTETEHFESATVSFIIQALELNAAPPALREAMFLALSRLPGTEIVAVNGSTVTLSFQSSFGDDWVDTLAVDTSTGLVVTSTRTIGAGGVVVPDSVPTFRTSNTMTIVDSAP